MLLFFSIFFIFFSFWLILFIFNSYFTINIILIGIIVCLTITIISLKLRLYTRKNEFLFMQLGFYKILCKKVYGYITESLYLAFEFLKFNNEIDPIIDYLFIDNENIYENNLLNSLLNLNAGKISTMVKNQCIIIHSMNKLFFSPNQLYFLNLEVQNANDDSLI